MRPLLANPSLKPTHADLLTASEQSRMLQAIRASEPLLHLGSARLIGQKITFPASGPTSTPGVIVEHIDDTVGPDADAGSKGMVVVFNASPGPTTQAVPGTTGQDWTLNPIQAQGTDPIVRTAAFDRGAGSFTVPARTVAVFQQH